MKKEYIKPVSGMHSFRMKSNMLAGSPGVDTGDGLGNEYNDGDVSYGKGGSSMWEYMEMEEE